MADSQTSLAIVALIVSLIALLITLMQLLASLFATAGGRHRCTETVIGPWGKFSKIKRHWLEARFEVFFMSPELRLASQNQFQAEDPADIKRGMLKGWWAVTDPNLAEHFNAHKYENDGWGALLAHVKTITVKTPSDRLAVFGYTAPAIFARMRTWDALPMDVSRPIASTTLHDIAVLASRMGFTWELFEPELGNLLAQDGPRVLSSIEIRGLGLALSYRDTSSTIIRPEFKTAQSQYHAENYSNMIRDERLDKFLFGILPVDTIFCPECHRRRGGAKYNPKGCRHEMVVRTRDDRIKLLDAGLGLSNHYNWETFLRGPQDDWLFMYGTNDIIHMCAPMLKWEHSSIEVFPLCSWYTDSVLSKSAGRSTFVSCLTNYNSRRGSQYLANILMTAEKLTGKRPWSDQKMLFNHSQMAYEGWRSSTNFLSELDNDEGSGFCFDLLRAHLSVSATLCEEAFRTWKDGSPIRDAHLNVGKSEWRSEQVHLMFDNIPYYVSFMKDAGWEHSDIVAEAWITLLFRGICWAICHVAAETGTQLPAKYYASMMPVYLV